MIFKLLAMSSGEDASMVQLARLIYYMTPMSLRPILGAQYEDFMWYGCWDAVTLCSVGSRRLEHHRELGH